MNKSDLIELVSELDDVQSKAAAKRIIDTVFANMGNTLVSGEDLSIAGFGTFYVADRAAREGRNPQTGETISIQAKRVPKFRPGSKLKAAVNA